MSGECLSTCRWGELLCDSDPSARCAPDQRRAFAQKSLAEHAKDLLRDTSYQPYYDGPMPTDE